MLVITPPLAERVEIIRHLGASDLQPDRSRGSCGFENAPWGK